MTRAFCTAPPDRKRDGALVKTDSRREVEVPKVNWILVASGLVVIVWAPWVHRGRGRCVIWMSLTPIAISGEAPLKILPDELVILVEETGFDLRRDTVPVAIDVGGETGFGSSGAPQIAFTDVARKRFDIVGRCDLVMNMVLL